MARTYKRDKNGRFAGGGGSSKKPAKKTQQRGTNRIRRDNAGKIQGIGGTGATGRGGRLRTAKGNKRATVTMQAKGVTPRGAIKGKVRRDPGVMAKVGKAAPKAKPQKPEFTQEAFARRGARAVSVRNPVVRARAQGLYRNTMGYSPKQLERAFRKTSKFSTGKTRRKRLSAAERDARDMMKLAPRLFR